MTRRLEISIYAFNAIRRKKKEYILKKKNDKRMKKERVTDAYILDLMLRKDGKF
jgi:hypothetical protein